MADDMKKTTPKRRDYGSPEPGFRCGDCMAIRSERRAATKKKKKRAKRRKA